MSHAMELLERGASELDLELTRQQLDQFEVYYCELADWNRRVNLTAITGYREVQVKHFLDSLSAYLAFPKIPMRSIRLVDVGTGAGFPGLPLKLAFSDICLVLVESVGKKSRFLEYLVEVLGLSGVEVCTGRAEELAHKSEFRESFDLVVSRGVAKLPVLLEYTLPFCTVGGRVALSRRGIEQELAGAARALDTLGGRLGDIYPVRVPGLDDGRIILSVDKVEATPHRYPRRPGLPTKRPL